MNGIHQLEPKNARRRAVRLAGVPAALALILALAGSASAGTARSTAAPSNTSPPTISGTVQEGQTLTADKGGWGGTEPISYAYAWQRCDSGGGRCADIKGAAATTYQLKKQDVANTLRIVVTAKNAEATISATSVATVTAVAKGATTSTVEPANTSQPTISGTLAENQTLTADKGGWSGTGPITYTYAWQRCDASGGQCAGIGGANNATYTLKKSDVDKTLRVVVTAKNAGGTSSTTSIQTAVVKVTAMWPAPSVTMSASTFKIVYGTGTALSGTVSTKQAGESVTVLAQRYEDVKLSSLATVTTGSGGAWSYFARPTIQTVYAVRWSGATSPSLTIGVKPLVTFHALMGNRFSTKVVAARSFATRVAQFQRRSSVGQWVTLKRLHLDGNSTAVFRATLPKGNSTLRIAFSVNQAGAGYLGGISRAIVYHRG